MSWVGLKPPEPEGSASHKRKCEEEVSVSNHAPVFARKPTKGALGSEFTKRVEQLEGAPPRGRDGFARFTTGTKSFLSNASVKARAKRRTLLTMNSAGTEAAAI